ncbi:MAG: D-alanyl-D-alanine carboxypeptidase, partial [Rhodobacteraceae bacterium]|nr:D-alanyl-D-alanine carboxypeptidase [Paracoccaceae bacterium]
MGNAKPRVGQAIRQFLMIVAALLLVVAYPLAARAAPYADYVIDARTGEVLHETNAHTRLHPASLTKMMTLYIAFEAVKHGEITLDTLVTVSQNAASEPPSRLGLRPGQRIALRYLIRAAAVRSANDAATAIGEAISGSESAFAERMTRTAHAIGMSKTTFRNANGLTRDGHLSTAHDMAILGRQLFFDHPEYYNIFSRRSTDAGIATVANTNRRFLDAYDGADGIKTGFTNAAGFNLVASARRGDERIIAAIFGGTSTSQRNARMAELLDLGFRKAPSRALVRAPRPPDYSGVRVAAAGRSVRGTGIVAQSP